MIHSSPLRIGTRGSALALWQARTVQGLLQDQAPDARTELEIIKPEGDIDKHSSLTAIGGRGVFTSALQVQLLDGRVDMAVHSSKDVPSLAPSGLGIAAYPQREDARDGLVSRHGVPLSELPANPVIGTSSRRRAVQVLAIRPDAVIRELRGNIDTRLKKGMSEDYDAVILAMAGLTRMGWADQVTDAMAVDMFVPSPGQGALAIETRLDPDRAHAMAAALDDADVRLAVATERAFLRGVGGGCTTPIGAHAVVERMHGLPVVRFWGMLASDDGARMERIYEEFPANRAEDSAFDAAVRVMRSVAPRWSGTGERNPLAGMKVLVTGSPVQADPLERELAAHGAEPVSMPTIRIEPVEDVAPIREAIQRGHDWVVLTSANAVGPVASAIDGMSIPGRVAVVGARTAEALERAGIGVDLTGDGPGADQLVEQMREAGVGGTRVLCLLSDKARPVLADGLRALGADVEIVTVYRNLPVDAIEDDVRLTIRHGEVGAVTFASPSAVAAFRDLVAADMPAMSGAAFFSIGPTTSQALREAGLPVHGEAPTQDAAGMVAAMRAYFQQDEPTGVDA